MIVNWSRYHSQFKPLVTLPHRSYWLAIGRYDLVTQNCIKVKGDGTEYFGDNQVTKGVIGLYCDPLEFAESECSDEYSLPGHRITQVTPANGKWGSP